MNFNFPTPQYLGSKFLLRNWIADIIPPNTKTVADVFGGSQSVSYELKKRGFQVYTNDILKFNHLIGKALIENSTFVLDDSDVELLFSENKDVKTFDLFENLYSGLFFNKQETQVLDSFRSNIQHLANEYKEALALAIMNRVMMRKVPMGHFAHAKTMEYRQNELRIKRNPSLISSIKDLFLKLMGEYNSAVFDNGQRNLSFNEDASSFLLSLKNDVEVAYFDPPYCRKPFGLSSFLSSVGNLHPILEK